MVIVYHLGNLFQIAKVFHLCVPQTLHHLKSAFDNRDEFPTSNAFRIGDPIPSLSLTVLSGHVLIGITYMNIAIYLFSRSRGESSEGQVMTKVICIFLFIAVFR